MSVTHDQCDARPTVTFPAARHHRPLAGTKLYCLVTEAHVLTTCPGLHSTQASVDVNLTFYTMYTCISASAPCGLRGCKNWPTPFPGRMS